MSTASLFHRSGKPWHRPSTTICLLSCSILCPLKCDRAYHYRFVRIFFQFFLLFVSLVALCHSFIEWNLFKYFMYARAPKWLACLTESITVTLATSIEVLRGAWGNEKWTAHCLTKRIRHEFYVDKVIATHHLPASKTIDWFYWFSVAPFQFHWIVQYTRLQCIVMQSTTVAAIGMNISNF